MEEGKDYWGNLPVPCKGVAAQNSLHARCCWEILRGELRKKDGYVSVVE